MSSWPVRAIVLLRLPALAVLVVLLPRLFGDLAAAALTALPYPHGTAKYLLESWQALLYRQGQIVPVVLMVTASVVALQQLRGRSWWIGAAVATLLGLAALPWNWLPGVLMLIGLGLAATHSPRRAHKLAWLPGSELLLPGLVGAALDLPRPGRALLSGVAAAALTLVWLGADCLASYRHFRPLMELWPDQLLDERITVLDRVPAGTRAEWHGVDVVGHHAIVLAEETTRILAYDLTTGVAVEHDLGERWGPTRAAPLDSETDPATGRTWLLDHGDRIRQLRWTGSAWQDEGTRRYPFRLDYVYLRRAAERGRLYLTTVQAQGDGPRFVASIDLSSGQMGDGSARELTTDQGPVPMPREVEWVPPLGKLVLAPDFGTRLYLTDPETGRSEPWLEVPTLDGKMRWSPELQRLFLAIPNRTELWVIDPVAGVVERRIATQPGVRSIAVDAQRGLLLTASVVTGQVLVQRLDDGSEVDRFGTVMPMVRELKLAEDLGIAVLSTWSVLYALPYAEPR